MALQRESVQLQSSRQHRGAVAALQQLFLEKPPWPCLVTENDKGINRQQLQQQKGEAALMVLLCHPVAAQVVDGSSVTAMQRDSLYQQSTWVMASATEPHAGADAMAPWGISNNIGNRPCCEF